MARTPDPALGIERRRQILEAALACFERRGFHAASIAEICAEAGISPGHLYHFFENKEAIVEAIVDQDRARRDSFFVRVLEQERPVAALFRLGTQERRREPMSATLSAEIMAEAARNDRIATKVREADARARQALHVVLRAGQSSGEVHDDVDLDAAATLLMTLGDGYLIREIAQPGFETEALRQLVWDAVLGYLSAPGGPGGSREPVQRKGD